MVSTAHRFLPSNGSEASSCRARRSLRRNPPVKGAPVTEGASHGWYKHLSVSTNCLKRYTLKTVLKDTYCPEPIPFNCLFCPNPQVRTVLALGAAGCLLPLGPGGRGSAPKCTAPGGAGLSTAEDHRGTVAWAWGARVDVAR